MQSNEVARFREYIRKKHQHMLDHWDEFLLVVSALGFIGYCIGGLIILLSTSISKLFIIPWIYSTIMCIVGYNFLIREYAAENGYTLYYDEDLVLILKPQYEKHPDVNLSECVMTTQTDDDGIIHVLT